MGKAVPGDYTMTKPKVHVLYAPGINCHNEMIDAFKLAGAEPVLCNLTYHLIEKREKLTDCDIIAIPGGFSFGDHIAAGRIFAIDLQTRLRDQLLEIKDKKIPVIGICNGFQVLVNTGLLPGTLELESPNALLDMNKSSVFESRWVDVFVQESNCIWTQGLAGEKLRIPVAHGEGRLIVPEDFDDKLTVLRYGSEQGTEEYPDNPNGSELGRAGICDPSGLIFGLMPHPERAIYPWLGSDHGIKIFKAGIKAVL